MRSHRALALFASALVAFLSLQTRHAEAQAATNWVAVKGMDERFRLDMGGFFQKFDTSVRIDSATTGEGTEIDFEKDLGHDSNQVNFRADGYWRFGRHGRLDFAYTGWNRSRSKTLDRDITVGDTVYHAGVNVDSRLKVTLAELYYGYSFWNTPEFEAGLMLGVSALFNKVTIEGSGTITGGGGSASGSFSTEDRSLTAPVPAIGAQFRYTLLPGFLASARVRGMSVTIDNIKGSVLEWRAGLDYYPWKNVGLGAAYDYMDITVTKEKDANLELGYKYSGPMAYVSLVF